MLASLKVSLTDTRDTLFRETSDPLPSVCSDSTRTSAPLTESSRVLLITFKSSANRLSPELNTKLN
jgi:hypothetical protein